VALHERPRPEMPTLLNARTSNALRWTAPGVAERMCSLAKVRVPVDIVDHDLAVEHRRLVRQLPTPDTPRPRPMRRPYSELTCNLCLWLDRPYPNLMFAGVPCSLDWF
jgi:hypothetical protein